MAILKDENLVPIGMICLAVAILVDRFLPPDPILGFITGVLTGVSIALNVAGLMRTRRLERREA